jgi:hypothetical protein
MNSEGPDLTVDEQEVENVIDLVLGRYDASCRYMEKLLL